MFTYNKRTDLNGNVVVTQVVASNGNFVLTGKNPFGVDIDLSTMTGDTGPTVAYRAWVAAGGVLGDPIPVVKPREAMGYVLVSVLSDDQVNALTTAKTKDRLLLLARTDAWPEDNPKVARIAGKIGITPAAWFDLALAPPTA